MQRRTAVSPEVLVLTGRGRTAKRSAVLLAGSAMLAASAHGAVPAQASPPTCFGATVTIMGTAGDDVLIGSEDVQDVIYGGGGRDTIQGGEFYADGTAPDLLCGGPGNDYVKGARGDDKLNGGDGDDVVDGSNGADVEQGNAGNDRVGGGSFDDDDDAADIQRGGPGKDTITTNRGSDRAYGQRGADRLIDTECGGSLLHGGPGDDYIESWSSSFEGWQANICTGPADAIIGGRGTDTAEVNEHDSVFEVEELTHVTSLP